MDERLGHFIRNQEEEIWITLREVRGEQQIEIRLHERDASTTSALAPGKEKLVIPVDLLPVLVKTLSRAQEALMNRGLIYAAPTSQVTQLERGDSVRFGLGERPKLQAARQHPRVPLNIRGECRLLDKKDFWPGKPVAGEVLNVSAGGAQVRLPQRFPRFGQVELFMVVDGMVFRGRAEVAGADAIGQKGAPGGHFCHSLRWLSLEGPARDVLAKIIAARAPERPAPTE